MSLENFQNYKMCDKLFKSNKKKRVTFKLDTPGISTTENVDDINESKSKFRF